MSRPRHAVLALAAVLVVAPASLSASAAPPSSGGLSGPLGEDTYAITSYMGPRCIPTMYASTSHGGVDFGAASGTPLYAIADGTVVNQLDDRVAGQWLLVEHRIDGRRVFASYSHLLDYDAHVRTGDRVRPGQLIARVGSTGVSTGPHLHFEIWLDGYLTGTRVEPTEYLEARGVNVRGAAVRAAPRTTPATCTYYAAGSTPIRASASASARVLTTVPGNTVLTGRPGAKSGRYVQVSAAGVTGWAHDSDVAASRVGEPEGWTTQAVPLFASPSWSAGTHSRLASGARIDEVLSLHGGWYYVRVGSTHGWVPTSHARLGVGRLHGVDYGFYMADNFEAAATTIFQFGEYYDHFLVGDWDGNGTDTIAVRRGNEFHLRNVNMAGGADAVLRYGDPGDEILVGDWDGNGTDTLAVRRGNTYHVRNTLTSGPADVALVYGDPGDSMLVGDFDGDGTDSLTVRRGNTFLVRNTLTSGFADAEFMYGNPGDTVLVGDFDGNGTDTLTVRRGNAYHLRHTLTSGVADRVVRYGESWDEVYTGDWNGDGVDSLAVYRW